jgi:hypothetical protein
LPVVVNKLKNLASKENASQIGVDQLSYALNVEWIDDVAKIRRGSELYKDNTEWGSQALRAFTDFKLETDNFYYIIVAAADGSLWYRKSNSTSSTYTQIKNSTSPTKDYPALSAANEFIGVADFNNKIYFIDNTDKLYYWAGDASDKLTLVTNPPDKATLSSGVGYGDLDVYKARLWPTDHAGYCYASNPNNGAAYTAGEYIRFDRIAGLKVKNFTPFNGGAIISTGDPVIKKYNSNLLKGRVFYDPTIDNSSTDAFHSTKLSSTVGIVGRSGQEVGSSFIGLVKGGFIDLSAFNSGQESFGIAKDAFLSKDLNREIRRINFEKADQIFSIVDEENGRYMCACPVGGSTVANQIFVYDFRNSKPEEDNHKWAIWRYPYNGISTMGTILGEPYIADLDGKIYKLLPDGVFNDNGSGYQATAISADIGAESKNRVKKFEDVGVFMEIPAKTDPEDKSKAKVQNITGYVILDNKPILKNSRGEDTTKLSLKPVKVDEAEFDRNRVFSPSRKWGSGFGNQFRASFKERLGKARTLRIVIESKEADTEWGISGFYVQDSLGEEGSGEYKTDG